MNNEPKAVRRNPRFGSALPPDQMIQKYYRNDPNWHVPFITKEDDFPGWPIAIGLMASAGLGCWGLWHLALWAGRL
jgi:hypothetical protein